MQQTNDTQMERCPRTDHCSCLVHEETGYPLFQRDWLFTHKRSALPLQ